MHGAPPPLVDDRPAGAAPPCPHCNGVGHIIASLCCGRGCLNCIGTQMQPVECWSCRGRGVQPPAPRAPDG